MYAHPGQIGRTTPNVLLRFSPVPQRGQKRAEARWKLGISLPDRVSVLIRRKAYHSPSGIGSHCLCSLVTPNVRLYPNDPHVRSDVLRKRCENGCVKNSSCRLKRNLIDAPHTMRMLVRDSTEVLSDTFAETAIDVQTSGQSVTFRRGTEI
jgi:hypothetical protein